MADNPKDFDPVVTYDSEVVYWPMWKKTDGTGIKNGAGAPFPKPIVEPISIGIVHVFKWVDAWGGSLLKQQLNKTNDGMWNGYAEDQAWISRITARRSKSAANNTPERPGLPRRLLSGKSAAASLYRNPDRRDSWRVPIPTHQRWHCLLCPRAAVRAQRIPAGAWRCGPMITNGQNLNGTSLVCSEGFRANFLQSRGRTDAAACGRPFLPLGSIAGIF